MPSKLPFHYTTPTGERFEVEFELHPDTVSAMRVSQLLERLMDTLDHEIGILGNTANGDVLQALTMALSLRAGMIHANPEVTGQLCKDLLDRALKSVDNSRRSHDLSGHA
ncbi:hypothetical protein [Thioalkalivibrio sulfidiphilus]|uniref:hypothetical protein n=1 Tax=Thioalkalivibrio sulfidiphilus TaxID=1033854 RepID=UPI00037FC46C|nr:hypothetical protein [Thioalkalivibrio sulfidiphilus]